MIPWIQWVWSYYAFLRRAAAQEERKLLNKITYDAQRTALLELREEFRKAYNRSKRD